MTAADPNRSRTPSSGAVDRTARVTVERQRQLDGVVVVEVGDGEADERDATLVDHAASPR